jgi:hypothetical protein
MSLSTIIVAANAQLLRRVRLRPRVPQDQRRRDFMTVLRSRPG